jgi:predicted nucleotidyltransferase
MSADLEAQTRAFFENDPEVRLAILFGSQATKRAHSKSDVDVAVAYGRLLTTDEIIRKAQELSAIINKEIDLVDLLSASGLLLQQILAYRKTLVNRDSELYGRIIAKRINEEEDLMPLYEEILRARRERFLNGPKGS